MDEHSQQYQDELNEAIKMSLMNFSNSNQQNDESDHLPVGMSQEEEKVTSFEFQKADVLNNNDSYGIPVTYSINNNDDNNIFEESKDNVERLSICPPTIEPEYDDNSVENCQETLKEYIDVLDTYYPEQKDLAKMLNLLKKIIGNICKDPNELKYHKIRVSKIGSPPALFLLELVGFKLQIIDDDEFFVMDLDSFNIENLIFLRDLLIAKLDSLSNNVESNENESKTTGKTLNNNKFVPMNSTKRAKMEKMAKQNSTNKNMLYDLAKQRETRKAARPDLYKDNPYSVKHMKQEKYNDAHSVWDQLKVYRQNMKQKNFYRQSKEVTIKDLEQMSINQSMSVGPNDIKRHGIRCLELTNKFRNNQGMSNLTWNDALYNIAMVHSKNMAEGKVAFGHDGFKERMGQVPFYVRSFSENVAYNYNVGDPCETAVTGWIHSPGHRKNLLSQSSH